MKRREFVTLACGATVAWPFNGRAQQPAMPVIGFLNSASSGSWVPFVSAFRRGLSETGYEDGRNVAIEFRWADEHYDRLPALAADLVYRRVAVIVANHVSAQAAKAATSVIPIVFTTAVDPVNLGLVHSLNRPGGNITGITTANVELVPKRVELLHELLPTASTIGLLVNPTNADAAAVSRDAQAAAHALGLKLNILEASTERDLGRVFESSAELQTSGLVIGPDPFFVSRSEQLASLALHHRVPTIFAFRRFAAAGGLMSYGSDLADAYRLAGIYAGRVLKGERPADLPVQQATKVELIFNLKTAQALGRHVPPALLARADEVIE